MKRTNWILIIFLALFSCRHDEVKPDDSTSDYIAFGHFYGECLGEQCIEIFKLTPAILYEDSNDHYPSTSQAYVGNYYTLSVVQFDKVKGLTTKIPTQLVDTTVTVIGAPDAGDWGGIYFEIMKNGKKQFWLIDKMESNIPAYLHPFVQEIEKDVALINN